MKFAKVFFILLTSITFAACNPSAKVVKIEAGVEAELISDENFVLDYGDKVISGIYDGTITLSNSGKFPITGLTATPLDEKGSLIYVGGVFPGTNGTCSSTIVTNEKCTIKVEFKPDHEGSFNFNIKLDYNTGISAKSKNIVIKGYAGSIAFLKFEDGSEFDFGIFEAGQGAEKTYTIKNAGGLTARNLIPAPLDPPFYYKGGSYPGTGGTCGITLAPYSDCRIVVELKTTTYENALKNFNIDYENGNGLTSIAGSFQALIVSIEADLAILASGVQDFGTATLEKEIVKKFKILNRGFLDATSLTFTGSTNFLVGTDNCSGAILKSTFCEFNVVYTPTVVGDVTESFTVNYFSGKQNRTLTLSTKGKGTLPAILSYDLLNVNDFGNQGVNSEKILSYTVKNTGDFTATGVTISGTSTDFIIDSHTCLAIMFKNSSCVVNVKFQPLSAGVKTGSIHIDYNNGSKAVSSIQNLTGLASLLAYLKYLELDPYYKTYEFGEVPVGDKRVKRVLVQNVGLAAATRIEAPKYLTATMLYNGDYNLATSGKTLSDYPDCGTEMATGGTCKHSGELFYNDSFVKESFDVLASYPDCTTFPETICKLNQGAVNTGVHVYPGARVDTTYPTCNSTIPAGQICQIVFEYAPVTTESIFPQFSLNYINDNLSQKDHVDVQINFAAKTLANLSYVVGSTTITDLSVGYTFSSVYNIGEMTYTLLTLENDGDFDAEILALDFGDTTHQNFSFNPWDISTGPPGVDASRNMIYGCEVGRKISGRSSCKVGIWFNPRSHGQPLTETLNITYNDGINNHSNSIVFKGTSKGIAVLQISPTPAPMSSGSSGITLAPAAVQLPGNSVDRLISFKNIGDAPMQITDLKFCKTILPTGTASCTNGNFVDGIIDVTPPTACTGSTLGIDESCSVNIKYSPQAVYVGNTFTMILTYTSSGETIRRNVYGQLNSSEPSVLKFTDAGVDGTKVYDYLLREYMEISPADLVLTNNSGTIASSSVVLSIENDVNNVFSVDSSNSTCGGALGANQSCIARVNFTPNSIGEFTGTLVATYFNGKESAVTRLNLKGTGEPPRSTHKGWSSIIAIGEKVNINSVSDNNIYAEVAWNDMTPKAGYTITGYNIYRRLGDGYYGSTPGKDDYSTPYNTAPISVATKKFKDLNVVAGKVYYYEVRPIIMGFPSRTLDNMKEVRVTIPFPNMVFVHRWMANTLICQRLGKVPDIYSNARCSFSGIGSKNNFFDLGYDMFVDRYELGADKTSRPGQMPIKATQTNALANCDGQGDLTILNISKTVSSKDVRKKLLTRKEFNIAAIWAATETDATIMTKEAGLTASTNCNGALGGAVENTGNNIQCKSYFGIEDAAGNEMEWVSDRIANGIGVSEQMSLEAGFELRLDFDNKDLAGVDFINLIPSSPPNLPMKDAPCFTIPLGLSVPINVGTGTCLNSKVTTSLGVNYLHNNQYSVSGYENLRAMAVGGTAYLTGTSGVYSSYWLAPTVTVGARCMMKLDY